MSKHKVKAIQWQGDNWNYICDFIPVPDIAIGHIDKDRMQILVKTHMGIKVANIGDVIKQNYDGTYDVMGYEKFNNLYDLDL